MATAFISTSTELTLLNTTTRAGVIILPSTTIIPGRILTFKDTLGTFGVNSITFSTAGVGQTLENNAIRVTYNDPFGAYTFVSGYDNKWYTIGGSRMFSANISSITSLTFTSLNISTTNITTSTLQIRDFATTSTNTLFSLSTNVFMSSPTNFFIVGPTKAPKPLFVPLRRPFLPNQIANLQFWIDAADVNTVVGVPNITRILDKSGNGRTATALSGTATYSSGVFNFGGAAVLRSLLSIGTTTPVTFFLVAATNTVAATFRAAVGINSYPGTRPNMLNLYKSSTNRIWFSGGTGATDGNTTTVTVTVNTNYIIANYWSPSSTQVNIDGTSYAASANAPASLTANSTLLIGSTTTSSTTLTEFWSGTISEVLIYNATLNSAQRQQVEGYLAWKWGLVSNLPSNHPFKNSPP